MSATSDSSERSLALISDDAALIAMTKGAFPSGKGQMLRVIEKNIQNVGAEVRDLNCTALIIDMDASKVADFEQLQKIKRMAGPACALIVVTSNFSPAAARILIQLKVSDFLIKPLQTSDLVRACNNALKKPGEEASVEPQFLAFMPASGGVGTTSMALETAQILNKYGRKLGRTTCVVDLNFQHGSCAEYLDIEPRFDISEIENAPERLDRQLLDVMLSRHSSGLSVIAAPNQPSEMRSFKAALVVRLLDLVSAYFDYVVIDMPRIWFPWTDTVLVGSNRLFVVADMTVPSIRHARRLVEVISQKVGNQSNAKVLVNRMDMRATASGLNAKDVEEALGEWYAGGIPNNYRLVRDAVDRGVPL
ncbi:MAG: response regulator receiver protein, partial [Nitratireductor sp.]|nr:response regulator receiver protein [Nitratireductor sp.]